MKRRALLATLAILVLSTGVAFGASKFQAKAGTFDPANTFLVQAAWLDGIGCPTAAKFSADGVTTTPYTDPACPTGDSSDTHNQGLLLAKTGPTGNYASAGAQLSGVAGMALTELGYDLRKPTSAADPRGSHCGAGAPRFNVVTDDGATYFVGCNSPVATSAGVGAGWLRLRWGGTVPLMAYNTSGVLTDITNKKAKTIEIVFDEGQDTAPDNFGLAVLDNIDVNGTLVGAGQNAKANGNGGDNNGDDNNGNGTKHDKNNGKGGHGED
jgi:hypothetical protein